MAQGPAQDAAQHVATSFIGGEDPVLDQEGGCAGMIGNDLQRIGIEVAGGSDLGGGLNQGAEQVDLIIAVDALQHRGHALQSHAGIHRGLGQWRQFALAVAVVLHEHQVPDFHVAVALVLIAAGRTSGHFRSVVVEDLGARAAGTRVAHRPEVA